jgi:hypothetical protein
MSEHFIHDVAIPLPGHEDEAPGGNHDIPPDRISLY